MLTSRRGPRRRRRACELERELSALGVEVSIAACDVADRDAVAGLLAAIPDGALTAVVHAAGVNAAGALDELDVAELAEAGGGQGRPAPRHLDELLGDRELDAFVRVLLDRRGVGQRRRRARTRRRTRSSTRWRPPAGAGAGGDGGGVGSVGRGRHGAPGRDRRASWPGAGSAMLPPGRPR